MLLIDAIQQFSRWKSFNSKQNTVKGYSGELRSFCVFIRNKQIEDVTLEDILDYFHLLELTGSDNRSFLRRSTALRHLFKFYKQQKFKVLDYELIPIPKKEFKIPRVCNEESYKKLISSIPDDDIKHIRNRAIIGLLWDTGARNGEICSINLKDIDTSQKKAIIHTEKSRGLRPVRQIFWTEKTNEYLKKWLLWRGQQNLDTEAFFVSVSNQAYVGKRIGVTGVNEMLRKYCNKAGLKHINAHSMRHHMGHQIVKKGGSNSDISNILGHSKLESSFIYTMMQDDELKERHKKFVGD